jgi:sulfite reductase (NADPH) hemoprotein beta-component
MPQVVIANRLKDGIVVFLGTDGAWLERVADSTPSTTPEEGEKLLEAGLRAEREQLVVGPTLIDVEQRDGAWVPIKRREAIRAAGPTVRLDLGKQAGN